MSKSSLKKMLIKCVSIKTEEYDITKNKIVIYTSLGAISGNLIINNQEIDPDEIIYDPALQFSNTVEIITDEYIKEHGEDSLNENDGYLLLKDVTIKSLTSNATTSIPFLCVFFDQVIGISIGRFD